MSMSSKSKILRNGASVLARGFEVFQLEDDEIAGNMIIGRDFIIKLKGK